MKIYILMLLPLLLALPSRLYALKVLEPSNISGEYESPGWRQLIHLTDFDFNVNASVIVADPPHCCFGVVNDEEFKDRIVLTYHGGRCSPLEKLRFIQKKGGKGMIFVRTGGYINIGVVCAWKEADSANDITIPMVCVWPKDGELFRNTIKNGGSLLVQLAKDRNEWLEFSRQWIWITFQVLSSLWYAVISGIAAKKLIYFIAAAGRIEPSIPQICLGLEFISNLLRLAYFGVDPQYSRGLYTFPANNTLFTLHMPFHITSSLFLTFYWHEISSRSFFSSKLDKLKIPFAITSLFIFVIEFISNYLRSSYWENGILLSLNGYVYIAIISSLSIFYWVAGYRLLRAVNQRNDASDAVIQTTVIVTKLLIASTIGMIMTIIGIVFFVLPFYSIPIGNTISWTIMNIGAGSSSLAFIFVFRINEARSESSKISNLHTMLTASLVNTLEADDDEETSNGVRLSSLNSRTDSEADS